MANPFRTRACESIPSVEKKTSLPADVTTPSLKAWRSYSAAMKAAQGRSETTETLSLLKRAIDIEPKFAMAYASLGRMYGDLGGNELGEQNIAKAYQLRDHVSDSERYFITFNYHRQVTGNLEQARQVLESWVQEYPRDLLPHGLFLGFTSHGSGRYERAAVEGQKAIELDPDFAIGYANVAFTYVYQNRLREAEATLWKASERKIDIIHFSLCDTLSPF